MIAVVSHFLVWKHITKIAAMPPVQAARVVFYPLPGARRRHVIHDGKRRAWIEAVPAKPENQSTDDGNRKIVWNHRPAAIALERAAQSRSKHDIACNRDPSADGMHNG